MLFMPLLLNRWEITVSAIRIRNCPIGRRLRRIGSRGSEYAIIDMVVSLGILSGIHVHNSNRLAMRWENTRLAVIREVLQHDE